MILAGGSILLLVLLLFGIRALISVPDSTPVTADTADKNSTASRKGESSSDGKDNDAEKVSASDLPEEPVSLTVSVVGDCTLGTDEAFDYDTSLNAYFYEYGKEYFLSNVKSIFEADDLTIANFEGTLTDSEERGGQAVCFQGTC